MKKLVYILALMLLPIFCNANIIISEIFPNKVRAYGQSWGTGTHWVFAAIITLVTPIFLDAENGIFKDNPWPIFIFFAFMMVLQCLVVLFIMPETKGVSLEELSKKLSGKPTEN